MKLMKRRRGATLAFVSVICLVIIVLGVGFFFLTKMMGGGRELAGATDSGTVNVAKAALLLPSKKATSFSNPDVANNFELLGEDGSFNLSNYNRLVAQSMIVALNAKEEGTVEAAKNAEKVWNAAIQVGQFLRTNHESPSVMGGYFLNMAGKENVKMMGGNEVSVRDYAISFMKRGGSSNMYVDPKFLATLGNSASSLPINSFGKASPTGNKYLQGYVPMAVPLAGGINLNFSAIPVGPQDRPHLVNLGEFVMNGKDDFIAGKGSPGFPADSLPANSFKALSNNPDKLTGLMGGATACAIVGALTKEFEMNMPNGYIEVTNGVSLPGQGAALAHTGADIFSHALAGRGIDVSINRNWFCQGGNVEESGMKNFSTVSYMEKTLNDPNLRSDMESYAKSQSAYSTTESVKDSQGNSHDETKPKDGIVDQALSDLSSFWKRFEHGEDDLIDIWTTINTAFQPFTRDYLWHINVPDRKISLDTIKFGSGDSLKEDDLKAINSYHNANCHWEDYYSGMNKKEPCLTMLPAFRKGYAQMGSTQGNDNGSGYTALEQFKANVLNSRIMCQHCAKVPMPETPSGMKWFDHSKSYPTPKNAVNFGTPATPYAYLEMIDSVRGADGCAKGSTVDTLLKRCQQIRPSLQRSDLVNALSKCEPLPLGATMYLRLEGNSLVLSSSKPKAFVQGTSADGKGASPPTVKCGQEYDVMYTLVDTSGAGKQKGKSKMDIYGIDHDENTDGSFPNWAFAETPQSQCGDYATWIPSSGYNNLLGRLEFSNFCTGGGTFCQPN